MNTIALLADLAATNPARDVIVAFFGWGALATVVSLAVAVIGAVWSSD